MRDDLPASHLDFVHGDPPQDGETARCADQYLLSCLLRCLTVLYGTDREHEATAAGHVGKEQTVAPHGDE
ncbi:hypothetical protein [Streptomyces sp. NPDC056701]|uniref:hypothetical protein n=1 Tax=Streptomyces sp. NPDC056701 TaxID=3345916 RepID=UPI0036A79D95